MPWAVERLSATLARTIARFEEEQMGVRPADIRVLVEDDLVMVHLKEVLSPSEREMARTEAGQTVLQRFNAMLFDGGSSPSIREQVCQALGRQVVDVQTTLSPLTGSLVVVFSLGSQRGP
jgi:uncharacterized protein YbcI